MRAALLAATALALTCAAARPALADDTPVPATPSPRPPFVVLRESADPTAAPTIGAGRVPELVVVVGGFGSDNGDDAFHELTTTLVSRGLVVRRFGADPAHPYDTLGSIDASADTLCELVHGATHDYAAVHVVAHSMGGVVVDRALTRCLGAGDVATYVAWSSPHAGSTVARQGQLVLAAAGDARSDLAPLLARLGPDLDTPAGRDLASSPPRTPRPGTVRLDLREATDFTVSSRDARDDGVVTRTLLTLGEGHGAILTDERAIDLTERTILDRRVPPDDRAFALRLASAAFAAAVDLLGGQLLALLCLMLCAAAASLRARRLLVDPVLDPLHRMWRRLPWPG